MNLRPATIDDGQLLLDWRNDPLTRQMSITNHVISITEHTAWLTRRLQRPDFFFIAEVDGVPVGTVRLEQNGLSYIVSPEYRGRGYATRMLSLILERYGHLRAEIKKNNLASIRAAEKAGHDIVLID